jgi:hypothetical protein
LAAQHLRLDRALHGNGLGLRCNGCDLRGHDGDLPGRRHDLWLVH